MSYIDTLQRLLSGATRSVDSPLTNGCRCLLWTKSTKGPGYGQMKVDGQNRSTHRLSYELFIRPLLSHELVLHRCDVRRCIEPRHLFVGSHKDNIHDMMGKGRDKMKGHAKVSKDDVLEIRRLFDLGKNDYWSLSAQFGLSKRAVWDIVNNRTWVRLQ